MDVLVSAGTEWQIGRAHGEQLARAVAANVGRFWERVDAVGWDRRAVRASARRSHPTASTRSQNRPTFAATARASCSPSARPICHSVPALTSTSMPVVSSRGIERMPARYTIGFCSRPAGFPTTSPFSITTRPRTIVYTGMPFTRKPWNGVTLLLLCSLS